MNQKRIVVHDYAGHPFQVQLSRELAARGWEVLHLHVAGLRTPKGPLDRKPFDPTTFHSEAIGLGRPILKERYFRRLVQERRLGRMLAARIRAFDPDLVLSGNAPLDVQSAIAQACRDADAAFVFWIQDLWSTAIEHHLRRFRALGSLVARRFVRLEASLVQNADGVVLIADEFRPVLAAWGIDPGRFTTIPNWAPIDDLPQTPRDNDWAREFGLVGRRVFLYAGTLGLKHNPALLRELAVAAPLSRVVIVSEGPAADWLRGEALQHPNLIVLPFQPFERLPQITGSADVLLAILEPEAGQFSVPSKILTYLCAGRPVLAAMPTSNQAARILKDAGAGICVEPGDQDGFIAAGLRLLQHPTLRANMGTQARAYAEKAFAIHEIADRFEDVFAASLARRQVQHRARLPHPPMALTEAR